MGFADQIAVEVGRSTFRYRKSDEIKAKLTPEEYTQFLAALADPTVPAASIARVLRNMGMEISNASVQNLRKQHVVQ